MTAKHETVLWTAGDDWLINATLLDANGVPYDLTSAEVKWALVNDKNQRVLDEDEIDVTTTSDGAVEGKCSIIVAATATTSVPGGRYTDFIRVISGGITSTLSHGVVQVIADPWALAEVASLSARQKMTTERVYGKLTAVK